ncbi:MAG: sensor histidine kinase [Gemmatimonadaceae bacterium]
MTRQQEEDLDRIQRSQKHLLGLINEVLNYARLETGNVRYDIGDVGVRGALGSVGSLVLPQVRGKALTLETAECDPALAVRADAEKLRQILLNLLSNAVKFTDSGGRITLSARARAVVDGVVEISMSDTGVGIAPDQLEAIFEPFVQVGRALSSPGEGTGLGLAICRGPGARHGRRPHRRERGRRGEHVHAHAAARGLSVARARASILSPHPPAIHSLHPRP